MKRILTIFLALVTLLSVLAMFACAPDTAGENQDDEGTDTDGTTYDPKLADLDFGGEEIHFVFAESAVDNYTARSIQVDEDNGNSVDTQLITRNANVENILGVTIDSYQASTSISGLKGAISNSLAAGNGQYDIIAGYQYFDISMATEGWLVDLNNLALYGVDDYINFDAAYWGTYYNENLKYGDARFWITGDIALRYIGGMYCTFVNKTIYMDTLYDEFGSIYDIARSGEWTMDKLVQFAGLCYQDNGNEKVDNEDQLGFAYEPIDPLDGIAFGCQVPFSTKYADGTIKITLNSDRTKKFLEKLDNLCNGSFALNIGSQDSGIVMPAFANGNIAFTTNKIFMAESYLQKMEDDYFVLPSPKLDENQEYYVTGVHDGCTIFGIAWDSPNVEAAAATLEVMAAESYRLVTPVYYESAIKFKYTRDNDSADMIDLIREHVETDFAAVWSESIDNIAQFFRANHTAKNSTSVLKRRQSTFEQKLEDLIKTLKELEESA